MTFLGRGKTAVPGGFQEKRVGSDSELSATVRSDKPMQKRNKGWAAKGFPKRVP